MTKIQEIHELLFNIQKGVSEKLKEQEKTIANIQNKEEKPNLFQQLQTSFEYTKGQLYEVNYILENFWDIISN